MYENFKTEWWDNIASDMRSSVVPQYSVTGCSCYKDTDNNNKNFNETLKYSTEAIKSTRRTLSTD